jgi:TatD DNase family protein
MAREYNLPVVIHSRDAFAETIAVLSDFADLKIYLHCRGYTPVEVKCCVELFPQLRIGYTGTVTYPKAVDIRESLLVTPLSSILTETDAPYLAPQPMRGKTNEPSFLHYTASLMAEQLGCDQQVFVDNARSLYGR